MENRTGIKDNEAKKTPPDFFYKYMTDEIWFDFVLQNRRKLYSSKQYDLVVGPVANDDVFTTLQLFENDILSRAQAIDALKVKKLYDQYTFASKRSISLLKFSHYFNAEEAK
ncbi:MAG: DUF3990 domain-containing protein [Synergistaceae bacterium]|nr:DUF3990 domain-containing protein [Synergistaceae bacterium]